MQKMVHVQQNAGPAMQHSQGPAAAQPKRAPPIPRKSKRRTSGAATASRKIDYELCVWANQCVKWKARLGKNVLVMCVWELCVRVKDRSLWNVFFERYGCGRDELWGDGGGGRGRTKGHWVQTSRQFILKNGQNHMTSLLHVITTIAYLFFNLFQNLISQYSGIPSSILSGNWYNQHSHIESAIIYGILSCVACFFWHSSWHSLI